MKKYHIIMTMFFFLPVLMLLLVPLRGQRNISNLESRTLEKIPNFSIKTFINGSYQEKLENSISDQLLLSQTIKFNVKSINNKINKFLTSIIVKQDKNLCNKYIEISEGYYTYNCSNYLLEKYANYKLEDMDYYSNMFNSIKADKYIYFIEKDRSIDFTKNIFEKEKVFSDIKKMFNAKKYSKFEIKSYNDLENYFYQTDHHWNYKGSYKGYKDIINLLKGTNEKIMIPKDTITFDAIYNGSASKKSVTNTSKEKFIVYKFENLKYKSYINDKLKEYGNKELYFNNKYSKSIYTNHYGKFYGEDYAKVVYDFNDESKKNLMIIATSYSNAINELVASHFNKTHIIDLRHYKRQYGEDINFNKYIMENNIDKVLIMGDIYSFVWEDNNAL